MRVTALRPLPEIEYIATGRQVFQDKMPGQDFDGHKWVVGHLRKRSHGHINAGIYWTHYGSLTEPLPPGFVEPIKAACVIDLRSATNVSFRADAARFLWEHLRQKHDPKDFQWARVTTDDMLGMEHEMLKRLAKSSTHKMCGSWTRIIELLVTARILRPMNVPWVTPRTDDTSRHTIRGQQERRQKLPSRRAMEAVADLFAGMATEPNDRLSICACVIAACTGLRVGELLTLPENCLTERDGALFVSYWVEKNTNREMVQYKVPRRARDLVLEAVTEARALTSANRDRAREIEASPASPPVPGYAPSDRMTPQEVAALLGTSSSKTSAVATQIRRKHRKDPQTGDKYFLASDLSAYLAAVQGPLWVVKATAGTQWLSGSLFVTTKNAFHHGSRSTINLVVEPVKEQALNGFLGGVWESTDGPEDGAVLREGKWWVKTKKSVFDRFGLTDDDGSPIEITSHQFRHWITTQARAGGASSALVKRWQNRSHSGDISAYEHMTMEQRVATLRKNIESGKVTGDVADTYFALVADVRDAFLENQLQYVHVTPMGLCVHDYGASPCPSFMACLKGDCGACGDYLHDKSDPGQVAQLELLETRTQSVLQAELALATEREEHLSENWITEQQQVLANIRTIRAADGSGVVQPFAENPSKFKPFQEA